MAREPQDIVVIETWAGQGSPRRAFTEAASRYSDAIVVARERMEKIRDAQYARLYLWGYTGRGQPELQSKKVIARYG